VPHWGLLRNRKIKKSSVTISVFNYLTPRKRAVLDTLLAFQLVNKFTSFYGNLRTILVFSRFRFMTLL
jgi:hypothetical protein